MANYSFPFGSVNGDRRYGVSIFTKYWSTLVGNGTFANPSDNLQVIAVDNNMSVYVRPGASWFNGVIQWIDSELKVDIEPADGLLNRIDAICVRFDYTLRIASIYYKKGALASVAQKPTPQRDSSANELILAYVTVGRGVTQIVQANIEDARGYADVCGIVHGLIEQVDVTTIFSQFYDWFERTKAQWIQFWNDQQDRDGYLTVDGINSMLKFNDKTVLGAMNQVFDALFGVGAIIQNENPNFDPNTFLPGTWERIKGRVLVGVDESDEDFSSPAMIGGSKTSPSAWGGVGTSGSTALTVAQLPSHSHSIPSLSGTAESSGNHYHNTNIWTHAGGSTQQYSVTTGAMTQNRVTTTNGAHTHNVTTSASTSSVTGSGSGHTHQTPNHQHPAQTIVQPYETCFIWKRIA